jgi:hypothetical protein
MLVLRFVIKIKNKNKNKMNVDRLINHVKQAIIDANENKSKINEEILRLHGMSGVGTRHFYNNIVSMPDSRYFEIGVWKGSSVCAAMYDNDATIVCMDNWAEFGGPKQEFLTYFEKFKGKNNATFIEADSFTFDVSKFEQKFNIYMYDGCHHGDSHYKALMHYINAMDDIFIYIVDDWNWSEVKNPTIRAIEELQLKILFKEEIITTLTNIPPRIYDGACDGRHWANGCGIFIFQK